METTESVYASCLNVVLQAAAAANVESDILLHEAGIDRSVLSIPGERVPLSRFIALYETAETHTADPDLGLKVGRIIYFLGLNLHLYMTTICRNLRQYLNVIPSTINLRGDLGHVHIRTEGDYIRLEWHPLNPAIGARRLLSDEILASSALIVGSICAFPVRVRAAHFSYSRPHETTALEENFGDNLHFDCDISCLYFERSALDYPLISLDYELGQDFIAGPQSLFNDSTGKQDAFLRGLREAMLMILPSGELTIDGAADVLGVSRRTLQRRLTERGSSFKQLLQNLREELSLHYLDSSRLGITEIAFLLGYSDQASFSNAFRSWRNCSPSDYRNNPER